jgi:DNA-binding MarR family transcriptional regulator
MIGKFVTSGTEGVSMEEIRQRELTEETIELLPALFRHYKSSICIPGELTSVPFGQIRIMSHLYHSGRSTVGEVASGIGVSLATASELVDRMVENGWVEKRANPADRRQFHLWLTDKAVAFGDQMHDIRRAQISSAFSRLDPEDRAVFVRGLRALIAALQEPAFAAS